MKIKQLLLFLFLLSTNSIAYAQTDESVFAPVGAKWYYDFSSTGDRGENYVSYISEKDTVVNNKNCKIIRNQTEKEIMYEEDGKIYYLYDSEFRKIYDFTVDVGTYVAFEVKSNTRNSTVPIDTVITINCLVENISYVNAGNIQLKIVTTSISADDKPDYIDNWPEVYTYYEKIGSMNDYFILEVSSWASTQLGSPMSLRCYNDEDINYTADWWAPENKACDYTMEVVSVKETETERLNVYPNPVADEFTIEVPGIFNVANPTVKLFDLTGKTFLITDLTSANGKVNISTLKQGIYMLSVSDGLNDSKFVKIIKL